LQGIYVVFIETIELNLAQIIKNLKNHQKLGNAYNYFIKDFLFFYFQYKLHCCNLEIDLNVDKTLNELKAVYIEKFQNVIKENFVRAFNLVKNVEKNGEMNGRFEKENTVNVQIIEHLVNYIVNMSKSFVDLSEEFDSDWEFLMTDDSILNEIKFSFSNSLMENYLENIFIKLDGVITKLYENSKDEFEIQKFYFFYYILYKMKDVFLSFLNSNISYLISENLFEKVDSKLEFYMNQFYNCFLNHIAKDMKILLMYKDVANL
jgi:hypothetical protein